MQTIEFTTNIKDGNINIPPAQLEELKKLSGQVRVIVSAKEKFGDKKEPSYIKELIKNPIKKKKKTIRELMDNPIRVGEDFKFLSREEANER